MNALNNPQKGYSVAGSARDEISAEAMRKMPMFKAEFNNAKYDNNWHEAHAGIRKYLEAIRSERYFFFHAQILSCTMLDKYLLNEKKNRKEELEATVYYLDLLREFKSGEYEIIARSMEKLKRHYSKAQLSDMAAHYIPLIEAAIAKSVEYVEECDKKAVEGTLDMDGERNRKKSLIIREYNVRALATMKQFVK